MILFVSAGQEVTRKSNTSINRRNMYLNYGLLTIATYFSNKGYPCIQVQGHFYQPLEFFNHYKRLGYFENDNPIFISIPSFYALSWTRKFLDFIRADNLKRKIIIGGRWLIDGEPQKLVQEIGRVDYIADGLGESHLNGIENEFLLRLKKNLTSRKHSVLDYSVLENRYLYQPSIEVSRGCGMGCSFCQEKDQPLEKLIAPEILCNQIEETLLHDSLTKMTPYFEASMFIPSKEWSKKFYEVKKHHVFLDHLEWRTESRVDSINPQVLPFLSDSGLKIIDLGLESASEVQLKKMSKTNNPKRYLERASLILKEAKNNNIKVKVNILLYAGECAATVRETMDWLHQHREFIFGVSVGPVVVYGWDTKVASYMEQLRSFGATPADSNSIKGVQQINLSPSIDHHEARSLSMKISREFMSAKNFFELKKFSYFSRDYLYNDFLFDLKNEDKNNLSFSI